MVRDPHESCWIAEGKRTNEQRIDDAEDSGAGANAEADDQDSENGESDVPPHGPEGVAQILGEAVQERETARLAVQFFCGLNAAEFDEGSAAGFFGSHAALYVFFSQKGNVGGEFLIKILVQGRLAEECANSGEKSTNETVHCDSPFWAAKKRPITTESCSQFWAAAARWREPRLVME